MEHSSLDVQTFLLILRRAADPFLSLGAAFSLSSLFVAFCVSLIFVSLRRRRQGRKVRPRVVLRALFPRRIVSHMSTGMDLSYLIFNTFVFGTMFGWALLSSRVISDGALGFLTGAFGVRAQTALPDLLVRAATTFTLFIAYEFGYWCHHYLCHRVPLLWEFHKVHHTANVLTPLTVFRVHPVDTWLFVNILALAVGLSSGLASYAFGMSANPYVVSDTNVILVVFVYAYVHFQHTHLWMPLRGVLGRLLLSPAHHQIHHSTNPDHFNRNLGSCLAVWDWLFGTLHIPAKAREPLTFGVEPHGRDPQTISEVYLSSFTRALRRGNKNELRKMIGSRLTKLSRRGGLPQVQASPELERAAS